MMLDRDADGQRGAHENPYGDSSSGSDSETRTKTRPEPPVRSNLHVAAPFDLEQQHASVSLIPDSESPDLKYRPTKCCCCCCDTDNSQHSGYSTMASCPPCLYKKRVGNFYVCFSTMDKKQDGVERIYCLVPMCWPMLIFTFSLMSLVTVPMLYFTIYKVHPLWACVELLTTFTLYSALALTSFRDFGVFPRYHRKPQPNQVPESVSTIDPSHWRICQATESFRPPGVVFCNMSGVLVEEIDHFCPWTGTTIAKKNLFTFYVFVVSLFVQIVVLVVSLITVVRSQHHHGHH